MAKKQEKRYCLCVELVIDGKKEIICLAKYDLLTLQKYTSFCSDANELLKFMPEDDLLSVKNIILEKLSDTSLTQDPFSIRGTASFNSKKIPILYKKDVDMLLLSKQEVIDAIISKYSFLLDDIKNDSVKDDVKQFLINIWDRYSSKEIETEFYNLIEKKLNCDKPETYDSRYEKVLNNKWMLLGISGRFLNKFVDYIWSDTKKRLDFISFIKTYDKNFLPQLSYEEKKKRISSLEKYLNEIGMTVHRIRKRIIKNMKPLIPVKPETKPIIIENAEPITEREILMYNQQQKGKNPVLDKILFLSEKVEKLNSRLLVSQNNEVRKDLENEIDKIEYEIYELENNKYFYTDSGELIKESEMFK